MKRIACLGTLVTPSLPDAKGGTEVWTANFVKELSERDYRVDLYAASGSIQIKDRVNLHNLGMGVVQTVVQNTQLQKSAHRLGLNIKEYILDLEFALYLKTFLELTKSPSEYDLIIDNAGVGYMSPNWDLCPKPVVIICHYTADLPHVSLFNILPLPQNVRFVFLTKQQYDLATWIPETQKVVIYHGLDIENFTFSEEANDKLLWLGRISPAKGLEDALLVANQLSVPLDIYGYKEDSSYFNQSISPLLNSQTDLIDNNYNLKHSINHKALLFPVKWEEAFGLVMLEALAGGTPVIAYARGSVPEVIEDGKTGFLVNPSETDIRGDWIIKQTGVEGLKEAARKIFAMSGDEYRVMRRLCRKRVETEFNIDKMITQYDELFARLIN